MKGSQKVIDQLNILLAADLAAIDQYFIHSRMYEDWGLTKLYEHLEHERQHETEHADSLIKRILFLEGTPDMVTREGLQIGKDVPEMLASDLRLETGVVAQLKEAITICETERDFQSRELLQILLKDTEEDHAYWLEQQLGLIDKIGLENYLQSQM